MSEIPRPLARASAEMRERAMLVREAIADLKSDYCSVCGAAKNQGHSFCRKCFYKLPFAARRRLYTPLSRGYPQIYKAAKETLLALWQQSNWVN